MKKVLYLIIFSLVLYKSGFTQKLNISGSIKDSANRPLSMASVTIEKTNLGIAADASGHFSLAVSPGAKILVSAIGYRDTLITVKDESPLVIVLRSAENQLANVTVKGGKTVNLGNDQIKNEILQAEFAHYSQENNISSGGISVYEGNKIVDNRIVSYHVVTTTPSSNIYQGSAIPSFHTKEDTKGSIYLFKNWMKGMVANPNDSTIIDDPQNMYNVNKTTGELTMTRDFKSGLSVDKYNVKFFILFDTGKETHRFIKVPAIDNNAFCEAIAFGDNYDIFKLTTTKFVKSDYHSDGIASTGNNYDEYVDTDNYYLLNVNDGTVTKFDLKKKSLKQLFTMPKGTEYLAAHKSDNIDDDFLKGLGDSINTN
jgi:hypothetical protein